ncbi:hypothetical protein [Spirosoma pollinicola]|uniref:Uncharacterized protein n=1 Tax=Spirosoma pollinicola TaxID=2057025 RepID=A0A2K8Z651_9BACT|nr:hypothetical protein [Spirosoma pollinicola]AUD05367.1 hypothetical protein CWM47_28045 [Spirosoma pollinicola]
MDTYLAALDSNNLYLRSAHIWIDSCQAAQKALRVTQKASGLGQQLLGQPSRQALRKEQIKYQVLRQTIHRQARLSYIQLIYQRKRLNELNHRQQLIRDLFQTFSWRYQLARTDLVDQFIGFWLADIQAKYTQKEADVTRLEQALVALNGDRTVNLSDTIYPKLVRKRCFLSWGKSGSVYKQWSNRFELLKRTVDRQNQSFLKIPSLNRLSWSLKTGQIIPEDFVTQFINTSFLIDQRMQTERDLHLTATYLRPQWSVR